MNDQQQFVETMSGTLLDSRGRQHEILELRSQAVQGDGQTFVRVLLFGAWLEYNITSLGPNYLEPVDEVVKDGEHVTRKVAVLRRGGIWRPSAILFIVWTPLSSDLLIHR